MTRALHRPALPALFRMFGLPLLLAGLLCLWALPARAFPGAGEQAGKSAADKFEEMDKNKNGKVVMEEFRAVFPNMREEAFVTIDKNGDGVIDRMEWDEFIKGHAAGMKPGPMGGMPPKGAPMMNNMPGNPMIPPPGSADMPLVTPPNGN